MWTTLTKNLIFQCVCSLPPIDLASWFWSEWSLCRANTHGAAKIGSHHRRRSTRGGSQIWAHGRAAVSPRAHDKHRSHHARERPQSYFIIPSAYWKHTKKLLSCHVDGIHMAECICRPNHCCVLSAVCRGPRKLCRVVSPHDRGFVSGSVWLCVPSTVMFHDDCLVATAAVCALPTVTFHSDRRGIFKG
jgi:hypothetical protein